MEVDGAEMIVAVATLGIDVTAIDVGRAIVISCRILNGVGGTGVAVAHAESMDIPSVKRIVLLICYCSLVLMQGEVRPNANPPHQSSNS